MFLRAVAVSSGFSRIQAGPASVPLGQELKSLGVAWTAPRVRNPGLSEEERLCLAAREPVLAVTGIGEYGDGRELWRMAVGIGVTGLKGVSRRL